MMWSLTQAESNPSSSARWARERKAWGLAMGPRLGREHPKVTGMGATSLRIGVKNQELG